MAILAQISMKVVRVVAAHIEMFVSTITWETTIM